LLTAGTAQLATGVEWVREEAAREAELLLSEALAVNRAQLRLRAEEDVPTEIAARYRAHIARRASGEPVAYILGEREFWSLPLRVAPGVLVPRADTECLVEVALRFLQGLDVAAAAHEAPLATSTHSSQAPSVLDLGTGSGAIALALASELPNTSVVAVEVSALALAMAAHNIARLAPGRVELLAGHWYEPVGTRRFTCIVSNPPYLSADDPHLPSLAAEPLGALVSGPDGFECYREIIAGAPAQLAVGGLLALEHGYAQGATVRALMAEAGFTGVATHRDLAGHERVTSGVRRAGDRENLAAFTEFKSVLLDP
jgi:release factor glutamine methyltransferase